MKIVIAQLNPIVGDVDGNTQRILETLESQRDVDLVIFPELFISGYPPRDLLELPSFIESCAAAARRVAEATSRSDMPAALFGCPIATESPTGNPLFNAALLAHEGNLVVAQRKTLLPTYDVFDESRYFEPAPSVEVVPFGQEILGVSICEDAWNDPEMWPERRYERDPVADLARKGATLFVNISASPYTVGKERLRLALIARHAREHKLPFVYVNQVGGNDELIFDGRSFAVNREGQLAWYAPAFEEAVAVLDLEKDLGSERPVSPGYSPTSDIVSLHDALVLGLKDYARKCGFSGAVLGLSGGIDSSVTCCLAVEALGADAVVGLIMPSQFSSPESERLARILAGNLGIRAITVPISPIFDAFRATLRELLSLDAEVTVAEENLQARIRGMILMAFSNRHGHLVLSTGNKSELSVGYTTLYGDLAGGLAVISDVPKTRVYELARHINRAHEIIPEDIIRRTPTAELRPNQTDQDTLPPYPILDRVLELYVEERRSADEIVAKTGIPAETVRWVIDAIRRSEYKRRQAPPGLKVTSRAFGSGRRMPIAARYDD